MAATTFALEAVFEQIGKSWDGLDFVVHAIGFSDKNELRGKFVDTSLDNFLLTMNISVYSFVACAQRAARLMKPLSTIVLSTTPARPRAASTSAA